MLLIGDPHVRPENLQESEQLLEFIAEKAISLKTDRVVILGDLFHTHRLIRMEVERFWVRWATALGKIAPTFLLVGNHDQPGDDQNENVMSALDVLKGIPNVTVVDYPVTLKNITYLPHTKNSQKFSNWVAQSNSEYLVCHQTFNGSVYENGFYAKDGLELGLVSKFKKVISGHIHKAQEFGNVWYPGTPRWDSISDANEDKGVWLFNETNFVKEFISTEPVCEKIISLEIKEGDPIPEIKFGPKTTVKLIGSTPWISKISKELKGKVKISSKPTDMRRSTDLTQLSSLEAYANIYKFEQTSKEEVLSFLESLA